MVFDFPAGSVVKVQVSLTIFFHFNPAFVDLVMVEGTK
jgi:hypothetical protein